MDQEQLGNYEAVLRILTVAGMTADSKAIAELAEINGKSSCTSSKQIRPTENILHNGAHDKLVAEVLYIVGMIGLACFTGIIATLLPEAIDKSMFSFFGFICFAVGAWRIDKISRAIQSAEARPGKATN
jgi:hypothetical protein